MKLVDLDPQLLRYVAEPDRVLFQYVESMQEAQGLRFLCPKCFIANNGSVGTHGIITWSKSRGTPDDARPSGRWLIEGSSISDLTLNGEPGRSRSVLIIGGCEAHFFVTSGEIELL